MKNYSEFQTLDGRKQITLSWITDTQDLRPLLKSLGGSSQTVTGKMVSDAITHWLALKRMGV